MIDFMNALLVTSLFSVGSTIMNHSYPPNHTRESHETVLSEDLMPAILHDALSEVSSSLSCVPSSMSYSKDENYGYILRFNCFSEMETTAIVIWTNNNHQYQFATYSL